MYTPLDLLSLETWVLLITIFLLIRYYINSCFSVLKKLNVPHHEPSIMKFGNASEDADNMEQFFVKDLEKKKEFGNVFGLYVGLNPRMTISDPEILKHIYIKDFSHFVDRQGNFNKLNGKVMNNALLSLSGSQWRRVRNSVTPTFSTSHIKEMFGHVKNSVNAMIANLDKAVQEKDGKFDTKDLFGKFSLDAVCSAAFGVNVNSQDSDGEGSKLVEMSKEIFNNQILQNRLVMLLLIFPSLEKIVERFNYSFYPKGTLEYFVSLTNAIREKVKSQKETRRDMMTSMMKVEISEEEAKSEDAKGLTQIEITANSVVMILAGYDTASSTITFLAYNLATHKDVQERLRRELDEAVEKHGDLTYEALNGIKYVTQCINESLRLYPPTPRNSRYCNKDITINGLTIPKGMTVDVPVYGMTRDEEYWDEPLKYNPDRMEDMSKIDPMVFQPFGAGPRNCVGMRFALIEVKMAICKIVQKFEIDVADDTPAPPLELIFVSSMRPKVEVLNLKVTPRA